MGRLGWRHRRLSRARRPAATAEPRACSDAFYFFSMQVPTDCNILILLSRLVCLIDPFSRAVWGLRLRRPAARSAPFPGFRPQGGKKRYAACFSVVLSSYRSSRKRALCDWLFEKAEHVDGSPFQTPYTRSFGLGRKDIYTPFLPYSCGCANVARCLAFRFASFLTLQMFVSSLNSRDHDG